MTLDRRMSMISSWAHRLLSHEGRITLLITILFSIQLNLLQIMQPIMNVLKKLESIFTRFFWDLNDHALRWRRWKKLCVWLIKVGWLHKANFFFTFSLKLWWLFHSHQSLWVQFLPDKCYWGTYSSFTSIPYFASPNWRQVKLAAPQVDSYIA